MTITAEYVYSEDVAMGEINNNIDQSPGAFMLPIGYMVLVGVTGYIGFLVWAKLTWHASIAVKLIPMLALWLVTFQRLRDFSRGARFKAMRPLLQQSAGKFVRFDFDDRGARRTVKGQIGAFFPWCDIKQVSLVEGGIYLDLKIIAASWWLPDTAFSADGRDALLDLVRQKSVYIAGAPRTSRQGQVHG